MRPTDRSTADNRPHRTRRRKPGRHYEVLLVDPDTSLISVLEAAALHQRRLVVWQVPSMEQAKQHLQHHKIDLAVIEASLPDGAGVTLAKALLESEQIAQTVLISEQVDVPAALEAMQAGAADFLTKPLDAQTLAERLCKVLDRQDQHKQSARRYRRLQALCQQLDQAREKISHQVDTLCADLVNAYQDLAIQVDQAITAGEYSGIIRDELDLKPLLMHSIEYVLEKMGRTNAVIFLPGGIESYRVGAFVNFQSLEDADVFLDHLADCVAPRIAEDEQVTFITDDAMMQAWLGEDDARWLCGREVIGVPCMHEGEILAVLMIFRDQEDEYPEQAAHICKGIAPVLGEALCRVIRVHHRSFFDEDPYGSGATGELP